MTAYYNEIDPFAAQWLRELIKSGHIAPGIVDERSIEDVAPIELMEFTQCHFFAGIGVWSYALRQAGWPDDEPIWTGSCPCQPFSTAGKGEGFSDERHLWPHFHWLISQCQPSIVLGEQVASKDGLAWLDLVQADLEGTGYAAGAVDLCAAGVGAPHVRQRLWWIGERLANANERRQQRQRKLRQPINPATDGSGKVNRIVDDRGSFGMADSCCSQRETNGLSGGVQQVYSSNWRTCTHDGLDGVIESEENDTRQSEQWASKTKGYWRDADWLFCRDGKWRPVEPGTSPLANGAPARVGRLRGYGNAINAEAAKAFIEAALAHAFMKEDT